MKTIKDYFKEDAIDEIDNNLLEQEEYSNIPDTKIALLIQEHHKEKATNTLIESYKQVASSKVFYPDPVILEIRKMNQFSKLVPDRVDFILADKSVVSVQEETLKKLNNIEDSLKEELWAYMRQNLKNFTEVIKVLD